MAVLQTMKATALVSNSLALSPISGFKTLDSQVAGHFAVRSKPCFLVDKDGFVLKMVDFTTPGSSGFVETAFFESIFNADDTETELVEVRKFLPSYHGLQQLNISGEHFWYLKLENLVSYFAHPSVMDIKIGQITYGPFAESCKVEREMAKYKFQKELGFRILGSKSFKVKTGRTEFLDKRIGKSLKPDAITPYLSSFLDLENVPQRTYIVKEIIKRLKNILQWFSGQERIKFYSSSILIAFDGEKTRYNDHKKSSINENSYNGNNIIHGRSHVIHRGNDVTHRGSDVTHRGSDVTHRGSDVTHRGNDVKISKDDLIVRMIDFPHTYIDLKGEKSLDTNYIYGLKNLIQIFECLELARG